MRGRPMRNAERTLPTREPAHGDEQDATRPEPGPAFVRAGVPRLRAVATVFV